MEPTSSNLTRFPDSDHQHSNGRSSSRTVTGNRSRFEPGLTNAEQRSAWYRPTALDSLIILLLLKTPLVQYANIAFDGARKVTDSSGRSVWISNGNAGPTVSLVLTGAILLCAAAVLLQKRSNSENLRMSLIPPCAFGLGVVVIIALVFRSEANLASYPAIVAAFVVLAVCQRRIGRVNLRLLAATAAFVVASLLIYQISGEAEATVACRDDKCGVFGDLWRSYFPQENNLGLFCATLIPLFLYLRKPVLRYLFMAGALLLIIGSGSRTALLMTAIAILAMVILKKKSTSQIRRPIVWLLVGAPLISFAVATLLLFSSDSNYFTNRGAINAIVWNGFLRDPTFGPGRRILYAAYENRITGRFILQHEHGQLPYLLTNVGIVGALLFVVLVCGWVLMRAHKSSLEITLLAIISVGSVTEPIWEISVSTAYFWSFALWLALVSNNQIRAPK